jgi:hypothetical protein
MPRRRLRARPPADLFHEAPSSAGFWFVMTCLATGLICLVLGGVMHKHDWPSFFTAVSFLVLGIGFLAIGLLELEWLERIIGFAEGIYTGLWQWFRTSWNGTLSDNELIGRRGATVIWVTIGFPVFVIGCFLALGWIKF